MFFLFIFSGIVFSLYLFHHIIFFFFAAKIFPLYLPQTLSEKLNGTFLPHTPWPFLSYLQRNTGTSRLPPSLGNTARKFELSSKEWESVTKHLRDAGGRLKWIMLLLGTVICKCPSLSRALKVYLINFVISLHVITRENKEPEMRTWFSVSYTKLISDF